MLPLDLIKKMSEKYPNWDEDTSNIRRGLAEGKVSWRDDLCYIPIAATLEITRHNFLDGAILAALTPWKRHKEIYHFNDKLGELLIQQDGDMNLPIEILLRLPYHCIYIDLSNLSIPFNGVWVHLEEDYNTKRIELRMLFIDTVEFVCPLSLHLTDIDSQTGEIIYNKTIYDAWKNSMNEASKYASKELLQQLNEIQEVYHKLFAQTIQLLLYILADNADVKQNPAQRKKYKKPGTKNTISEVRQWDLGDKVFYKRSSSKRTSITEYNDSANEYTNINHGTPKRPHSRRGHWHHFWVGAKGSPERKLVLRWMNPMIINAGKVDNSDLGTTINILSEKKGE